LVAKLQSPEAVGSKTANATKPSENASESSGKATPAAKPPKPKLTSFRVKLNQVGGDGSRILVIRASDEDEARRRAILDLGDGWKVLSCEPK
jgi:hypothetical protein